MNDEPFKKQTKIMSTKPVSTDDCCSVHGMEKSPAPMTLAIRFRLEEVTVARATLPFSKEVDSSTDPNKL